MLKPEPMTRCLIIASKEDARPVIEALHGAGIAHLNDFSPSNTSDGLRIGRPLPEGSGASARLVRLRAVARALGIEPASGPAAPAGAAPADLDATLARLEADVAALTGARDTAQTKAAELRERRERLQLLQGLPLRLEDYKGYTALTPFVGRVRDPIDARAAFGDEHFLFTDADKNVIALFVPADKAPRAQELLSGASFVEIEVPDGTGSVSDDLSRVDRELNALDQKVRDVDQELHALGDKNAPFVRQSEAALATEVEKAEAPLHFGHTEYAFVADVWVPSNEVDDLRKALDAGAGASYHMETVAAEPHGHGHGHDDGHAHADQTAHSPGLAHAAKNVDEAEATRGKAKPVTPPVKYANGAFARPYETFTDMFSRPKYDEIDPTFVVALAFPLFFGLMIGDWGFGILMMLIGGVIVWKLGHLGDAAKSLGVAILAAGLVATATGWFVFSDGFGIPNGVTHLLFDEVQADIGAAAQVTCADVLHHEATWDCLLKGGDHVPVPHDHLISKINNVPDFLAVSLIAAFFHLLIGYLFGVINESHHSIRHAAAKVGWMFALVGLFSIIMSQIANIEGARVAGWLLDSVYAPLGMATGTAVLAVGGILTGIGVVILMISEEGILRYLAPIESLGLLSNIISYSRLAGVAVAKGAMIFAFNSLFLVGMIIGGDGNVFLMIFGIIGLVVCQLLVLGLGILSSGIQGIRLQYVEFFLKFYKGGGTPYAPFGRKKQVNN